MKAALVTLCLLGVAAAQFGFYDRNPLNPFHKPSDWSDSGIDSDEHGTGVSRRPLFTHLTQQPCTCGRANKLAGRIVGGKQTQVHQFPFMAAISKANYVFIFCGGTIISENHVLTAAHCTVDFPASAMAVLVGKHYADHKAESSETKMIPVGQKHEHELYNTRTHAHDIALLTLSENILFSAKIGPACMPPRSKFVDLTNKYIKVIGWGDTRTGGPASPYLQHANLKVISMDVCAANFRSINPRSHKQLCTFSNRRDTCQGDSGGPLVYPDPETNMYTLIGLVSYGRDCAGNTPGVNTDVAEYLDWIHSTMRRSIVNPRANTCSKRG